MIFGRNTTRDISKLSQISLAQRLVKLPITISKYRSWYLCQISLQIMLLPIHILLHEKFLIPSTDYSDFEFLHLFICWWEQWWHIGESTRLPPIWSGFIALCGLSLVMVLSLVSRGFFFLVFPFSSNTSISEFQFDQEW